MNTSISELQTMSPDQIEQRLKERVLERIKSPIEWPDNGSARMGLLQVAYDKGWYVEALQ